MGRPQARGGQWRRVPQLQRATRVRGVVLTADAGVAPGDTAVPPAVAAASTRV